MSAMIGRMGAMRASRSAHRGQMMVVFALSLTVMVGALMLSVDLSHIRAEVERAQHAANAAALAGVVFMPNYQAQAFYRANEEATKNGYTTSTTNGISVTESSVPGYNYRLKVTISEPVPLFFGHLFGLGSKQISVSATAEFLPPLEMGSPDYVLGFPRFPSYLTSAHSPQNFYLSQNGAYTLKENGDPYDPYFESFSGNGYGSSVGTQANPCASGATCPNTGVVLNQLSGSGSSFTGYKYIISVPDSRTVLVKLFDPFDEMNYNLIATCWDEGYQGATTQIRGLYNQWGNPSWCNGSQGTPPTTKLAPQDITPKDTAGNCVLGSENGGCRNEAVDGSLWTNFGPTTTAYGGTLPSDTATPGNMAENTLEFSLTGPGQSLLDPAMTTQAISQTPASLGDSKCTSTNCVIAAPFDAGNDPTTCNTSSCSASSVAYKFVNYAILHGPGYFQLTVKSVANTGDAGTDALYGEGNNAYGIAVCNAISDTTYTATYANSGSPTYNGPLGSVSTNTYVTADPVSTVSGANGWNSAACPSPNNATNCPDPRLASPGQCVQIYGEGLLPLFSYLGAGSSLIPLGYIPSDYAGRTVDVDLFDPGDVDSSSTSPATIFGCLVPTTSTSGSVPENSMEVVTPAGDLQCSGSTNHVDGNNNTAGTNTQPGSLAYTLSTAPDYSASGYTTTSLTSENANAPLDVGNGTRPYNGTWVHLKIGIPSTYAQMVNGDGSANSAFGAYWKVLYRVGGDGHDATTWALSVEGSAVHLVNP